MSAQNPDRQQWEREWTAMRNARDLAIRNLAAEYRAKSAIADPQQKKRLRLEQRKAEAAIVNAHVPEDFGAWLQRKTERDEATLKRLGALFQDRSAKSEREAQRVAALELQNQKQQERAQARQARIDADVALVRSIRHELRELGVRDDKLPAHEVLLAQLPELRKAAAAQRNDFASAYRTEAERLAGILHERGRSQSRGRGMR
jgi:hypothetical protein